MGQHKIQRDKKVLKYVAQNASKLEILWIVCARCFSKDKPFFDQTKNTFKKIGELYFCKECLGSTKHIR